LGPIPNPQSPIPIPFSFCQSMPENMEYEIKFSYT
jgi:hypothetical protein